MCTSAATDSMRCSELSRSVKPKCFSRISTLQQHSTRTHTRSHRAAPCMAATASASSPPPSTAAPTPSRAMSALSDAQCHALDASMQRGVRQMLRRRWNMPDDAISAAHACPTTSMRASTSGMRHLTAASARSCSCCNTPARKVHNSALQSCASDATPEHSDSPRATQSHSCTDAATTGGDACGV